MREIIMFIKRHKIICILILICMFITAKYSNIPSPIWLPFWVRMLFSRPVEGSVACEWLSLLNNLSLSFLASIIVYVIIDYIPQRREAKNAYTILKKELSSLYLYMSRLIRMYLFEIGLDKEEKDVKLEVLNSVNNVEITDVVRECKISEFRNGIYTNSVSYGYNLYADSVKYSKLVNKSLERIKNTVCCSQLDEKILTVISTIENNWFLGLLSSLKRAYMKSPSYQSHIINFDKGFAEFIESHIALSEYDFDKTDYKIESMSTEKFQKEKEKSLFMTPRSIFQHKEVMDPEKLAQKITDLEPTKERLEKSTGVVLEMLIHYDSSQVKEKVILESALRIAEHVFYNSDDTIDKQYAHLNCLQIKKRQNSLSQEEIEEAKAISADNQMPVELKVGAAIICEDYEKAAVEFEKLSEEERSVFIELPIYHLWNNPPVAPASNPRLFVSF